VPKTYEFEFEAPPDLVFQETLGAVSVLGFSILESEAASFTFNTGPSIWSNAGQDMMNLNAGKLDPTVIP